MPKTVTLTDDATGKSWKLPVLSGTTGPDVIDIRKFYGETGMFTFDPGFTSTGAANPKSLLSTATRAFFFIAAIRSISWRKRAIFLKLPIFCNTANCRTKRRKKTGLGTSPITRWCMNN